MDKQASMPVIWVAFVFTPAICPPADREAVEYSSGRCLGAFVTLSGAQHRVLQELANQVDSGVSWDTADGDVRYFMKGDYLYYGYVRRVPLDRRVGQRRLFR